MIVDHYWIPGNKHDPDVEYWCPVPEFEGDYEVSTHGRVRRISGGRGSRVKDGVPYVLSCQPNSKGYPIVNLYKNNERVTWKVHKIMERVFVGKPPTEIAGDAHLHHDNADKTDNRISNFKQVSAFENRQEQAERYAEQEHEYFKTGKGW